MSKPPQPMTAPKKGSFLNYKTKQAELEQSKKERKERQERLKKRHESNATEQQRPKSNTSDYELF